jgi:hypothetical protein
MGATPQTETTDTNGKALFENLTGGEWKFTVRGSKGYKTKTVNLVVPDGETISVTTTLERGSGNVEHTVVNADGEALATIKIDAEPNFIE